MLQEGLSPAQIAERLGISTGSVRQYLWVAVGEGLIRRSDILFSLPKILRQSAELCVSKGNFSIYDLEGVLDQNEIPYQRVELEMVWNLTVARAGLGDLYEYLISTEKLLHEQIHKVLAAKYGDTDWWRQGVPEKVRLDCVTAREKDTDGDGEPFAYTTLIHLREILERQWPQFQNLLPKEAAADKKAFLRDLERLNGIRNRVMHPTRLHKISDDDFEFAREMHRKLRAEAWRTSV